MFTKKNLHLHERAGVCPPLYDVLLAASYSREYLLAVTYIKGSLLTSLLPGLPAKTPFISCANRISILIRSPVHYPGPARVHTTDSTGHTAGTVPLRRPCVCTRGRRLMELLALWGSLAQAVSSCANPAPLLSPISGFHSEFQTLSPGGFH